MDKKDYSILKEYDKIHENYRQSILNLVLKDEVIKCLSNTRLWNSELSHINIYVYHESVNIYIYEMPYDMIVDFLCSAIHKEFGSLWTFNSEDFSLTTLVRKHNRHCRVYIYIKEGEMQTCEFIDEVVGMRSDAEIADMKQIIKRRVVCPDQ